MDDRLELGSKARLEHGGEPISTGSVTMGAGGLT